MIELVLILSEKVNIVKALTDGVDTWQLVLNIMAAWAEYECELIRERTSVGLQAPGTRVRGRPKRLRLETAAKIRATSFLSL